MALEDVCGFTKTPLNLGRNSPPVPTMNVDGLDGNRLSWKDQHSARGCDSKGSLSPFLLASLASPAAPLPFSLSHGTTTLAFVFQGGIMVAADTRASCSGLVACPAVHKVMPVHSHLVATTSGSGADCMFWQRVLARECRLYQLRNHRRLSVGGAAKLFSHMLHPFKGTKLCVALTLCGWDGDGEEGEEEVLGYQGGEENVEGRIEEHVTDVCVSKGRESDECRVLSRTERGEKRKNVWSSRGDQREAGEGHMGLDVGQTAPRGNSQTGDEEPSKWQEEQQDVESSAKTSSGDTSAGLQNRGPRLYYVCSDGTFLRGELFSVGSGSPYAYSVLDGGPRWGLSVADACLLAREAVFRATHRDAYSGNCVDIFHITAKGWRRREREDLREEYYRDLEKRG